MNGQNPFADMRRQMEKLFGHPTGAFDPGLALLRDAERVNKALEDGFTQVNDMFGSQALEARLRELHPEMAVQQVNEVVGQVVKILQPNLGSLGKRRR